MIHLDARLMADTASQLLASSGISFDQQHAYLWDQVDLGNVKAAAAAEFEREAKAFEKKGGKLIDFRPDITKIIRLLLDVMADSRRPLEVRQYAAILLLKDLPVAAIRQNSHFYEMAEQLLPSSSWLWEAAPTGVLSMCGRVGPRYEYSSVIPQISKNAAHEDGGAPMTKEEAVELQIWNETKVKCEEFVKNSPSRSLRAEVVRYMTSDAQAHHYAEYPELFSRLQAYSDIPYIREMIKILAPSNSLVVGAQSPQLMLTLVDSRKPFSLADCRGKFLLIDFWAAWCGGCAVPIHYLQEMYPVMAKHGFEILSISFDRDSSAISAYRQRNESMPWLHAWEPRGFDSDLAKAFHVTGLPMVVIISPDGKIAEAGHLWGQPLERKLKKLLEYHAAKKTK